MQYDGKDALVGDERGERFGKLPDHALVDGVEDARPVEGQDTDPILHA
jgi:hypothetical protein